MSPLRRSSTRNIRRTVQEIDTRKSSDVEGFVKDSEIVTESKEDETVNVDCCSDTDAINIRNGSTHRMPTAQNMNNMSYVHMVTKLSSNSDNKLVFKATEMSKEGKEFVVFDEELVKLGSAKWQLTVVGRCVGFRMSGAEMRYHLRRMWGRFGLKDVINKPLVVQKWDPDVEISNIEPTQLPVWVKFFNIPLEAWCVEGISAISSSIGKPLIMDSMTANMCKQGFGRIDYARVLVEIDASKGFKDVIKLMYKDKQNNCKGVKKVKVEYSWKPLVCDFCKVFGHVGNGCTNKPKVINVDTAEKASVNEKMSCSEKDSFTNVNYKRKNQVKKNTNIRTQQNKKIGSRDKGKSQQIPFKKPEVSQRKPDQNWKPNQTSSNRMIVDSFLNKKLQPSVREVKDWSKDMVNYFKQQWEIDRHKEIKDQMNGMRDVMEDVLEDNSMTGQFMTANVVEGMSPSVLN
ncbi:RNA-directed DNA polymerase, eukaryota, reverse transcriptase zinc-binding domain protein [Tanacetum coccineum]